MDGDNKKGVLPIGQVAGIMTRTLTVKQIIDSIIKEARKAETVLSSKLK